MFSKNTHFFLLLILSLFSAQLIAQFDGYALYTETNSTTTYLIDADADIALTWESNRSGNYAVLLMESGNIMRGTIAPNNAINGAAVGGMVQEIAPDGTIVWEFTYSSSEHVSHHDITLMPNGGVLLTAWEVKTTAELQTLGYDGNDTKYATHFIEVQPDGNGGGEIVWEWHIIDHFVQDEDTSLDNYGVISEHPERLNINVAISGSGGGPGGGGPGGGDGGEDWFHVNGINYNAELDQIAFSSRFLSEVFIIDHSTTTEEAAGHTGGNSGKGGDFLYRWGNAANYGYAGAQQIAGPVHDVRFIPDDGRPRAGYLMFFNNIGGPGGDSAVDALELPRSADGFNYDFTPGVGYAPTTATWRHECVDNADGQSAANSMPNGNVFVNLSREYMYEADQDGNVIWQYANESPKAFRYVCADPGIQTLLSQGLLKENFCTLTSTDELELANISISPNPSAGIFQLSSAQNEIQNIQIYDCFGRQIQSLDGKITAINISNQADGIYLVKINLTNQQSITKKISLLK